MKINKKNLLECAEASKRLLDLDQKTCKELLILMSVCSLTPLELIRSLSSGRQNVSIFKNRDSSIMASLMISTLCTILKPADKVYKYTFHKKTLFLDKKEGLRKLVEDISKMDTKFTASYGRDSSITRDEMYDLYVKEIKKTIHVW